MSLSRLLALFGHRDQKGLNSYLGSANLFLQPCSVGNTASMLSKMLIILFWKVFKPDFSKMRQRSPLRNFMMSLAKKQAPIQVSAVWSSFARMSLAVAGRCRFHIPRMRPSTCTVPTALSGKLPFHPRPSL